MGGDTPRRVLESSDTSGLRNEAAVVQPGRRAEVTFKPTDAILPLSVDEYG